MAGAAGPHEYIRLRNAKLLEKHIVHFAVVVLAGMDDLESQAAMRLQRTHDRRDFHEIGPRTGDQKACFSRHFRALRRVNHASLKDIPSRKKIEPIFLS